MKTKLVFLSLVLLPPFIMGGCDNDGPVPAVGPTPMNGAVKIKLVSHSWVGINYDGSNLLNFTEEMIFMVYDSDNKSIKAPWTPETQIYSPHWAGGASGPEIFACTTVYQDCTTTFGRVNGQIYDKSNKGLMKISVSSDDDGRLRITLGSNRLTPKGKYPIYAGNNELQPVSVAFKLLENKTNQRYIYGGCRWGAAFGARLNWQFVHDNSTLSQEVADPRTLWHDNPPQNIQQNMKLLFVNDEYPFLPFTDCYTQFIDSDGDGWADQIDDCPLDPINGDSDGDGILDCNDLCVGSFSNTQPCAVYGDADGDGDVDMDDYGVLQRCIGATAQFDSWWNIIVDLPVECRRWDYDHNHIINSEDVAQFMANQTRQGIHY